MSDHLLQADPTARPDETEMLEAYATLGFVAAHTEYVRVGAMVTNVTFRPPAVLVRAVTTFDVLTEVRAWPYRRQLRGRRGCRYRPDIASGNRSI